MHKIFAVPFLMLILCSWQDHPDSRDFSREDRHFRDMQEKNGMSEHDRATVNPERDYHQGDYSSESEDRVGTYGPPDRDK